MRLPDVLAYNEAVQNPRLCFQDPELKEGVVATNALGWPMPATGNFAAVYKVSCPNQRVWAVKCFTREVAQLQQRYQAISTHLQKVHLPFMVDFQYQDQAILVQGQRYPILKMQWVEGKSLNGFVQEFVGKAQTLEALAGLWAKMAWQLRNGQLAHGDLQHGNVLLVPIPKGVRLRLIDYDGMFVPALARMPPGELGHANFQHPSRKADPYHAEVDRFSHLVIYTAMRCLAVSGPGLWNSYDNSENLLFREQDFEVPQKSPLFQELCQLPHPECRALVGHLLLALQGSVRQVSLLENLLGPDQRVKSLTTAQQQQINSLLRNGAARVKPPPPPPPPPKKDPWDFIEQVNVCKPAGSYAPPMPVQAPAGHPTSFKGQQPVIAPASATPRDWSAAFTCTIFGIVLAGGGWFIPWAFFQAIAVLAGAFFVSVGVSIAVDPSPGPSAGNAVFFGLVGFLWWAAAWWWLEDFIARIIVGALGGLAGLFFLGFCLSSEVKKWSFPRLFRASGVIVVMLFLCIQLSALFFRAYSRPEMKPLEPEPLITSLSPTHSSLKPPEPSPKPPNPKKEPKTDYIFTNSLGMKFAYIPPGNFMMGSPPGEKDRSDAETQHKATLTKGFYLGVYEVTQEQWQAVMGNNPSYFKGEKNLPVENVSWGDCQEFIRKLSQKEGREYRLPTEAEWEYGCRAGTPTAYYFGDNPAQLGDYAWFDHNSGMKTHPVGLKKPNAWGLYDMHGNVWEWCQDWYGEYNEREQVDPQGPSGGSVRVFRGGSWDRYGRSCRAAYRDWYGPADRILDLGFRLALVSVGSK